MITAPRAPPPDMTLREYYAAAALPTVLDHLRKPDNKTMLWSTQTVVQVAKDCFAIADAMVNEAVTATLTDKP